MSTPARTLTGRAFGASVRGPAHQQYREPNQDAWLAADGAFGSVLAVADGMGSKPAARLGAQAACRATRAAAHIYARNSAASADRFAELVESVWRVAVAPTVPDDASATCLFSYLTPNGKLLLGQLGDGICVFRTHDGTMVRLPGPDRAFANETPALGEARATWQTAELGEPPAGAVLLATDGVADDLREDRIGDFIAHLVERFAPMPARARATELAGCLRRWPTPGHRDDKTAALHLLDHVRD